MKSAFGVLLSLLPVSSTMAQVVSIGLSPAAKPQAKLSAMVSALDGRRRSVENSASTRLQKAFSQALAEGKASIDAVVSKAMSSSFLGGVRVKVLSSPGIEEETIKAVENFETGRETQETKKLDQAAAELGIVTNVVVRELQRSLAELHGTSFLESVPGETAQLQGSLDVEVKAGKAAFPTVLSLVEAMEHHRDLSENSLNMQVLDLQTNLVKALNAEIVAALRKYK